MSVRLCRTLQAFEACLLKEGTKVEMTIGIDLGDV
jgi:hypothetical protein